MTVSRSAWLGALAVTAIFLLLFVTRLKLNPREWRWKETLPIKAGILASFVLAVVIVQFFSLTTFQLWNRFGSTGSGLQKITVSCRTDIAFPDQIQSVAELRIYDCRHINLEDIEKEKAVGNLIREVSRPDPNFDIRRKIYATAWNTFREKPLLGIGWGNGYRIFGFDGRGAALNSSNLFIETWLGAGILGLLSLAALFGILIVKSVHLFLRNENRAAPLFVLLGLTAIIIPNFFNAGMFLGFFWVFLGIAVSLTYETR